MNQDIQSDFLGFLFQTDIKQGEEVADDGLTKSDPSGRHKVHYLRCLVARPVPRKTCITISVYNVLGTS